MSPSRARRERRRSAASGAQPAILSDCPGTGAPHVVFPSDSPTEGTGPGAIVWSVTAPCPTGAGVLLAPISAEDLPGQPAAPRTAAGATIALRGPVSATGGPYGRVVIAARPPAGEDARSAGGERLLLTEGAAGGPFAAPLALGGPAGTFAFATAYLGDAALASLADPHGRINVQLRVQRHHAQRFAAPAEVTATGAGADSIEALTVALDFRSDRLVVFSLRGSLFARELPGKGAPHALQRLGPSPPAGARIAAVLSDDDRAIVAWTVRHDGQTSVYVSHSQPGVRFTQPQLLEAFPDPPGLPGYVDSPQLVRLSSESVMLAWTGAVAGHWAIRAAAIDQRGVLPPSTISPAGSRRAARRPRGRTERRGARAVERTAAARPRAWTSASRRSSPRAGSTATPNRSSSPPPNCSPRRGRTATRPSPSIRTATVRSRPGAPARARSPTRSARPARRPRTDTPRCSSATSTSALGDPPSRTDLT